MYLQQNKGEMYKVIFIVIFLVEVPDAVQSVVNIQAPEIICSKGDNSTLGKPDYSIMRILPENQTDLNITWLVRWIPLTTITQRQTIMAWNSVRDIEKKLNGPQAQSLLYIIKNEELLSGVSYIFNLTAISSDGTMFIKSFSIKSIKDSTQAKNNRDTPEWTSDDISLVLLGGRSTYADLDFSLEADVTACSFTQDYYFVWEVYCKSLEHILDVSTIVGSRLEIPRYSLKPGFTYEVKCQVKKESNETIKEVIGSIEVYSRGLDLFLSVDNLAVSTDSSFTILATVVNHDYKNFPVQYEWRCFTRSEESCDFIETSNNSIYEFPSGIPITGEYTVMLTVTALNQSVNANATINAVSPNLPVLQISPVKRILNEGSNGTKILGKACRVPTSCILTWYFAAEGFQNYSDSPGTAISEAYSVFTKEENFLSELADFSNETEIVEIEVDITLPGRARFVAECNCTNSFSCESIGVTYAEVQFQLNERPNVEDLVVLPKTGLALETLFQIRSRARDPDGPLQYSFYCSIGCNETLLLGSYSEYDAVETFLPYIDGETVIWVELCDALGACTDSTTSTIQIQPSSGRTFDSFIENARAHLRRCELIHFLSIAMSGAVSYRNAGQTELAALFTRTLAELLPDLNSGCSLPPYRYAAVLSQLAAAGFDITPLLA